MTKTASILSRLFSGDKRTILIKKNIAFSFLIKSWSGLIQYMLVPATLFCIGRYKYGIWMSIANLINWINNMDIGLGNGLRNSLADSLAHNDVINARKYISSTFIMLTALIVPIVLLSVLLIYECDIYTLINVNHKIEPDLREILYMTVTLVAVTFIFKSIGNIYLGLQLPAINNALVVSGQTLTLIGIGILLLTKKDSLLLVSICYTGGPLVAYLIAYPYTFYKKYPELRPSYKCFDKIASASLIKNGIYFFILQVASLILFATSSILISKFFNPSEATPYNITYTYFTVVLMLFVLVASPYWSATTDAYAKKDLSWIRTSLVKIHKFFVVIAGLIFAMVLLSNPIFHLWVGDKAGTNISMTILMAIYMIIFIYSLSYSYFLNGMGKLRLQMIVTVTAALLFIPIAKLSCSFFGVNGMILALIIINLPGGIINNIQLNKLLSNRAKGIWDR